MDLAQLELNYSAIRAPIDGVISNRFIKAGNMVNVNDPAFKINDFDPLNAVLYIPERHMKKLKCDQQVDIKVDAAPDEVFTGYVKRISPVVDPESGTCKVTIEATDPLNKLKPGMFGRVSIIYDTHHQTLLVPKEALMAEDKETAVFVVNDSIAFRKVIETGYVNGTHVEILAGVEEGDTVVTIGQTSLKDSSKVEIIAGLFASE
jgi:membrane fusion protein (multidrug efflux system)